MVKYAKPYFLENEFEIQDEKNLNRETYTVQSEASVVCKVRKLAPWNVWEKTKMLAFSFYILRKLF